MSTVAASAALRERYVALPADRQQEITNALLVLGAFLFDPIGTAAFVRTATLPAPLPLASPAPSVTPPPAPVSTPRGSTRAAPMDYRASRPVSCEVTILQAPRKPTPGIVVGQRMQLQGHENVAGPKGGRYTLLTGTTPLGPATFKFALRDYEVLSNGGTAEAWCVCDATPGVSQILGTIGAFQRR